MVIQSEKWTILLRQPKLFLKDILNFPKEVLFTTNSKSFTVSEAETPPEPNGYLYMDPINGNACDNEGYEVIFVPSNLMIMVKLH